MNITKHHIKIMKKPGRHVGRDGRAADELVSAGLLKKKGDDEYTLTKAGQTALDGARPVAE